MNLTAPKKVGAKHDLLFNEAAHEFYLQKGQVLKETALLEYYDVAGGSKLEKMKYLVLQNLHSFKGRVFDLFIFREHNCGISHKTF
jgi:hypothetical protein